MIYEITPADFPMLAAWWQDRGGQAPDPSILKLGVRRDEDAAGFLYLDATGAGVAVIAWTVTNPHVCSRQAAEGLREVIAALEAVAREHGYPFVLCHQVENSGLHRQFARRGYQVGDSKLVQLFKSLA